MDERNVDPVQEMLRVAENILDLARWNFKETFRSNKIGELIYDSEYCRIKFLWDGWAPEVGNSIAIYYGRLHAPNEKATMIWNDEECHCWHRFEHALHFLDGCSPAEAVKLNYSHQIKRHFHEKEIRKKYYHRQPEWMAQLHAAIWQHYGLRLFELFDLRRLDLWEQYRQFLKEFYDIDGRIPAIKPSLDKVC